MFGKKLIEKVPDARNGKQHYDIFLRMKNRNSVKQLEIITYQQKTFQNPNIVDIKPVITEHPKIAHKLSKTVRKKKVDCNSSLYSDTKKLKNFFKRNKCKNNKTSTCF